MEVLKRFLATESAGGMAMIAFAALALVAANSPLAAYYHAFVDWPFAGHDLKTWVADLPMALFFLTVGMELKCEMREGCLARRGQVALPLAAAVAGMVVPALIFLAFTHRDPQALRGWAIPSATDIAFALAVLMIVAKRLPPSLKVFLLALAIFDDLGAILIIALFYSAGLNLMALGTVTALTLALAACNRAGIRDLRLYLLLGVPLWIAMYRSGIHATLSGVILGFAIPLRTPRDPADSPLARLLDALYPWVSFLVLPLFAFTSAGMTLAGAAATPVTLGIAAGLFLGKQAGVFGVTWLLVRLRLVALPEGATWGQFYGVSVLAGIGFTMSLFIGLLAYRDPAMHDEVRLGVLTGSLLSAVWGIAVLKLMR